MDSNTNTSQNVANDDYTTMFLPGISYDDFIDKDIFTLMKVENMTKEQQNKLLKTMIDTIQHRVIKRILEMLSEEDFQTVKKALTENDQDSFSKAVASSGINVSELFNEEAVYYKIEMVNTANRPVIAKED
ncbi:MAG: hypothetical protein WC107_02765 [Patescibacteria group bacterium]